MMMMMMTSTAIMNKDIPPDTHGTAMGTKMAVAFANIFMSAIETEIIRLGPNKPLMWKRYIYGIFSLWNIHN